MTENQERYEVVEHYAETAGIIESMRVARRQEESARVFVNLSFTVNERSAGLLATLAANLKNSIVVQFGNIQIPLLDDEAQEDSPQGKLVYTAGNGEPILPHPFKASEEDSAKCTFCEFGGSSDVHVSQTAANLIEESRREVP